MALAPTAPAATGPISSASKGIKTIDVTKAPIPLPHLEAGERCFRSRSRGLRFIVHDIKPREIDGKVLDGDIKIGEFTAVTGFYDGQVYDFGEWRGTDKETIKFIEGLPEFGRLVWDAVERDAVLKEAHKADRIKELRNNPELLAAVRAELFELEVPTPQAPTPKRGPGRPRKVDVKSGASTEV